VLGNIKVGDVVSIRLFGDRPGLGLVFSVNRGGGFQVVSHREEDWSVLSVLTSSKARFYEGWMLPSDVCNQWNTRRNKRSYVKVVATKTGLWLAKFWRSQPVSEEDELVLYNVMRALLDQYRHDKH
jgi:hypothetical protein